MGRSWTAPPGRLDDRSVVSLRRRREPRQRRRREHRTRGCFSLSFSTSLVPHPSLPVQHPAPRLIPIKGNWLGFVLDLSATERRIMSAALNPPKGSHHI